MSASFYYYFSLNIFENNLPCKIILRCDVTPLSAQWVTSKVIEQQKREWHLYAAEAEVSAKCLVQWEPQKFSRL